MIDYLQNFFDKIARTYKIKAVEYVAGLGHKDVELAIKLKVAENGLKFQLQMPRGAPWRRKFTSYHVNQEMIEYFASGTPIVYNNPLMGPGNHTISGFEASQLAGLLRYATKIYDSHKPKERA